MQSLSLTRRITDKLPRQNRTMGQRIVSSHFQWNNILNCIRKGGFHSVCRPHERDVTYYVGSTQHSTQYATNVQYIPHVRTLQLLLQRVCCTTAVRPAGTNGQFVIQWILSFQFWHYGKSNCHVSIPKF